jgi:hypothetical protein
MLQLIAPVQHSPPMGGYRDTARTLERAPWQDAVDPLEGIILHQPSGGM